MFLKKDRDPAVVDRRDHEPAAAAPAPRAWSLAARLTAWYALSSFALILLATVLLYWALSMSLDDGHDLFLADKIRLLSDILHQDSHTQQRLEQEVKEGSAARQYARVFVRILDAQGKKVVESPGMDELLPARLFPVSIDLNPRGPDSEPQGTTIRSTKGIQFRTMTAVVSGNTGRRGRWTIQAALSKLPERRVLEGFRQWLWTVLAAALVGCIAVGYEIARQGMQPVNRIAAAARRVRSTTLHERIDQLGLPAELSDLAVSFNDMLDRLEEAFARLSRFSADIAHELRTPVNNLRGQSEVALNRTRSSEEYRETLGSCLEESVRLSRIIDSLLFLARSENPRGQLRTESVRLLYELEAVLDFYEPAAAEAGIRMEIDASPHLSLNVDRTLFQRAVGNLIANALAHTPAGGRISIAAQEAPDQMVRITVSDTGSGIAPEHLPHVLDRFYRADRSRSAVDPGGNVGLGLAIVRSIASMHGGRIEIASEPGRGTQVTLFFPSQSGKPATATSTEIK